MVEPDPDAEEAETRWAMPVPEGLEDPLHEGRQVTARLDLELPSEGEGSGPRPEAATKWEVEVPNSLKEPPTDATRWASEVAAAVAEPEPGAQAPSALAAPDTDVTRGASALSEPETDATKWEVEVPSGLDEPETTETKWEVETPSGLDEPKTTPPVALQDSPANETRWQVEPPPLETRGGDDETQLGGEVSVDGDTACAEDETREEDPERTRAEAISLGAEPTSGQTRWSGDGERTGAALVSFTDLRPGLQLGPYVLLEQLGAGGMGVVFRAHDQGAAREVAIKLIRGQLSQRQRDRFLREGQLSAALQHENLVQVHAAGEFGGVPYLVYALVEGGQTLADALRRGELRERVELLLGAARGLAHAHAAGIVHRDVKPANVLVDAEGRAHVADFGLAFSDEVERLTKTGAFLGTPAYMAPEQTERERVGPWTDVWALGVMLYEALTDSRPFLESSGAELHARARSEDVPAPSLRGPVPRELEAICLHALKRDPAARYPDAGALAADLEAWLEGRRPSVTVPPPERGALLWVLLGTLLFSLAAIGFARLGSTREAGTPSEALSITLEEAPQAPVRAQDVRLKIRVDPPQAELSLVGPGRLRSVGRGRFACELPLKPGTNTWRLVLEREGHLVSRELTIEALPVWPTWFERLPAEERPALRPDLEPAEAPRTYRWARDASLFVWVPPGTFRYGPETPIEVKNARLTRGFFLARTETTYAQYEAFAQATGRRAPSRVLQYQLGTRDDGLTNDYVRGKGARVVASDEHPVLFVTWDDAVAYCEHLGARLPTSLEWQWAASGPKSLQFPWGDDPLRAPADCSQFGDLDGHRYTSPVGVFPHDSSPFGALDMAGNTREWVAGGYLKVVPAGELVDWVAPLQGKYREARGGCWSRRFPAAYSTSHRSRVDGEDRDLYDVGFRVALDAPE